MSYTIKKYYKLSNIESFKNKYQQLINLQNKSNNNLKSNDNILQIIIDFNLNIMNDMNDNNNIKKYINSEFILDNLINKSEENNNENKKKSKIKLIHYANLPIRNIELYFDDIFNLLKKKNKKIDIPDKYKKYDIYYIYNLNINLTNISHSCINYIYLSIYSFYDLTNKFINLIFYDESNEYFPILYFTLLEYKDLYVILDNIKMYYFKFNKYNTKRLTLINTSIDNIEYE